MLIIGKTIIVPEFDSGYYEGRYSIHNEYLTSCWFDCKDAIWDRLSLRFALIVEEEIKKEMKSKMNEESYKEIFDSPPIKSTHNSGDNS